MTETLELNYLDAADVLDVSPRHVRTLLRRYEHLCPARRYGHRTVRFQLKDVLAVNEARKLDAIASYKAKRKGGRK